MASTYSSNLRLELMDAGDQVGTWGTTANTNMGTLIEAAISGYVSVSVTAADQAFTALNGSADQSRNAFIALTTITGANFNVYAPPAPKSYTLYNASAYVATVYNSTVIGNTTAAGTGVAIPAGKTITVWSDGTNFSASTNHILSATTAVTQTALDSSTKVATTEFVTAADATLLALIYPVGSIYTSVAATNPGTLFGIGTWTALAAGRMLMGAGGAFAPGATGGSNDATLVSHSHTFAAVTDTQGFHSHGVSDPTHVHSSVGYNQATGGAGYPGFDGSGDGMFQTNSAAAATGISIAGDGSHAHNVSGTTSTGGSSATNANLPPYLVVYMWQRTA
jgi:hypothetical protein